MYQDRSKTKRAALIIIVLAALIGVGGVYLGVPGWIRTQIAARDEWKEEGHTNEATVSITAAGFVPATLTVPAGTRVYFENHDTQPHRIIATSGSSEADEFGSSTIDPSSGYAYSFHEGGNFTFHDGLNPLMNGEIQVQ
jgi:plastocyanin